MFHRPTEAKQRKGRLPSQLNCLVCVLCLSLSSWPAWPATSDWLGRAVIYGIALPLVPPPAFTNIREHLGTIAATGANTIWLSPLTDAPDGDFGYAVTDHFKVRASFGSEQELRALVEAAHSRGMRVLLDMAVNHLSDQHPYYVDAAKRGRASQWYNWFDRDGQGVVTHYFDWSNLENLNYDESAVRDYVRTAFIYWLRQFRVDGFRVDAAWAVRKRAPDFWATLSRTLRRIDPDLALIAEATARDPYYSVHGFDAAYDWTDQLGQWAWQSAFEPQGLPDLSQLQQALSATDSTSAKHIRVLRFLNNNDTGPRFLTRHGMDETRSAMVLLFMVPGLPLIYQGDEQGAQYEPYRTSQPLPWRDCGVLSSFYARLAQLRQTEPALRSWRLEVIPARHDDVLLSFLRPGYRGASSLLVIINFASVEATASVTALCGDTRALCVLKDLLTNRSVRPALHSSAIQLQAHESLVLRKMSPGETAR